MVSRGQRKQRRRQTGGGWGFDGSTIASAGGAPQDVRSVTNDCQVPVRAAPIQLGGDCGCNKQRGGSRRRRSQRGGSCGVQLPQRGGSCGVQLPQIGGGCGCSGPLLQQGGGGGGGGYAVDVATNELGKVAIYNPGSCQKGGEYPLIPTHTASYSVTEPVLLDSGARYLEVQKAGTRRNRRRKARKSRRRH
jgi:hypothetical protein